MHKSLDSSAEAQQPQMRETPSSTPRDGSERRVARRRLRFGLRSALVAMVAAAVASAVLANVYRNFQHQEAAAKRMQQAGFGVDSEPRWRGLFRDVTALRWEPSGAAQPTGRMSALDDPLLSALENFPALHTLSLSRARIGDAALVHVGKCRSLRSLDLSHTDVTDDGLHPLAGLNQLAVLDVTNTQTTDEGIERLRESLPELEVYDD
jgi:hypothetical protein